MKKLLLPLFFLGTIAMIFVMVKTGASLKTVSTPHGILDLEFAYNTTKTTTIINAWQPSFTESFGKIAAAKLNTQCDFLFLFFYAGFLFLACKKIAANINGPVAKAGNIIAKGAIAAGIFDMIENAGMLLTLNNYHSSAIAFGTTFFSVIKWGLALIAVLYVLTGLLVLAYRKLVNG